MSTAPVPSLARLPGGIYYGWAIVGAAFVVNVAGANMNPVVVSFFIRPMGDELGWGLSEIAWAITLRLVTGGVAGPFLGSLVDRYGTRWVGAATGLIGGATTVALFAVHDLWLLYALFAISGIAGFGGPAGAILTGIPVAKWFVVRRGRAMALTVAGMAVGTVIAVPLAQLMIDTIGWRWAWVVFGIAMTAIVVPSYAIFMRRQPEDHGLRPDGAAETVSRPVPGVLPAVETDMTLRQALGTRVLWLILAAHLAISFTASGTVLYRVPFWQDEGLSSSMVALGTTLDPALVMFTVLLFGVMAERVVIRYLGMLGALCWAASIVPMLLLASLAQGETYAIFVHNAVWAVGSGATVNFMNLVWPIYFGRRYAGAIRGAIMPMSLAVGAMGAPVYGYIIEGAGGFSVVWAISLIGMSAPVLIYFFARPPGLSRERRGRPGRPAR